MRRVSTPDDRIVVVGAGATPLIGELIADGYQHINAVDISPVALDRLRQELGAHAADVAMHCTDVRALRLATPVDVWHDRAVFHFLTDDAGRAAYATRAEAAVRPGGHLIIATFGPNGPSECSGLPVTRHDVDSLAHTFAGFMLVDSLELVHVTPWGSEQQFVHALFRRTGDGESQQARNNGRSMPGRVMA